MSRRADRIAFLVREPRLSIAQACRDQRLTRHEIAAALGRDPGGVSSADTMLKRRALQVVGHRGARRAELLRLNPSWRPVLDQALRERQPGTFETESDLLLVATTDIPQACRVLGQVSSDVRWGIPLHGEQLGLMLATTPSPDSITALRAMKELQGVGVEALRLRLSRPLSAAELASWARAITADENAPQLPPAD